MTNEEESIESKGPSWTLIGAGLVVGVVVAMGAVLSVQGIREDDPAKATSTSSGPVPSSSSTEPGSSTSTCQLPGHETSGTLHEAPKAAWTLLNGFAVPTVKAAGPGKVERDGFRFCYAQTREGSLVAAANFIGVSGDAKLAEKVTDKLIAPGPGREIARRSAAGSSGAGAEDMKIQIAGFRMISYSDQESTVDVLMRGSNGQYVAQQLEMRWAEGDWRLALADDGSPRAEPRSVPDAAGFIAWSGA